MKIPTIGKEEETERSMGRKEEEEEEGSGGRRRIVMESWRPEIEQEEHYKKTGLLCFGAVFPFVVCLLLLHPMGLLLRLVCGVVVFLLLLCFGCRRWLLKQEAPKSVKSINRQLRDKSIKTKGILVLAATNRPHAIDAALLHPGCFDLVLYVPPPDLEARYEILRVHTRNMKVGDDVDLRGIAEDTELFTGAELEGLCREAGIVALRENISATVVCNHHFQTVKDALKPALTKEEVDSFCLRLSYIY
ncbi:hypothetical protein Q3G72_025930 [Acer saccharum]|nr:hypothetical protein Q3G72_025930 [Acer saccharum]